MATIERVRSRADARSERSRRELGEEFRSQRLAAGWSQAAVAAAGGVSRPRYTRVEGGHAPTLTIDEATRLAAVLGLDLAIRVFPGAGPRRDAAHAARLRLLLGHVAPPLFARLEVPLPPRPGGFEQRAWDAVIEGGGRRTAIELEMRLRDGQATERRMALKRRDDPVDAFVLAVADTRRNRRILAADPTLFPDLPRTRRSVLAGLLHLGRHPSSCLVVL